MQEGSLICKKAPKISVLFLIDFPSVLQHKEYHRWRQTLYRQRILRLHLPDKNLAA
jgi:hypothetical protein